MSCEGSDAATRESGFVALFSVSFAVEWLLSWKIPYEEIRRSNFTLRVSRFPMVSRFSKETPAVPASSPVDLLDLDDGASPPVAPISQSPSPSAPSGDMLLLDMVRSPEISGLTTKERQQEENNMLRF